MIQSPFAPPPVPGVAAPAPDPVEQKKGRPIEWPVNFTKEDFTKLKASVKTSYEKLDSFRKNRLALIEQHAGSFYGDGEKRSPSDTVVNLLGQMVRTYCEQLVSANPQVAIRTNKMALKAACRNFEVAANHVLKAINIQPALELWVIESLFSMGILKVGVDLPEHTSRSYPFDSSAIPFCEAVFFDDFVFDTNASRWDQIQFCGDQYKELREVVLDDPRNNSAILDELTSSDSTNAFTTGMTEKADHLSTGKEAYENDDKSHFRLQDVFLPKQRVMVTWVIDGPEEPLRVNPWTGPPSGPYIELMYEPILNNVMPKAPAHDIAPLSDLENELVNKMGDQAQRQKTITYATLTGIQDAKAVINASDGETINVIDPNSVKEVSYGGVRQETLTFAQWVNGRASEEGGNLKTLAGLATGADTLGQEELLKSSSSGRIKFYQLKVYQGTARAVEAIAWYIWNDPLVRVDVIDKVPGTDMQLDVTWPIQQNEYGQEFDTRMGQFNDYNFSIEPFSMSPQSPAQRLQQIRSIVETELLPMMQMLTAQGISIDLQELIRIYARLTGLDELLDIVKMQAPVDDSQTPVDTGGIKPSKTTRVYDSRSTKTPGSDQTDSLAKLIGGMKGTPPQQGA
jgi:hypothetical protein